MNENPSSLDAEAAEWLVELRDPESDSVDAEARTAERDATFLDWLAVSPEHVLAFESTSGAFAALDALGSLKNIDVRRLINDHPKDVIPLYPSTEYVKDAITPPTDEARKRRSRRGLLALAASLGVLTVAITIAWTQTHPREYVTAVGEQRTIHLDDGSIIDLNTASRIQVRFTKLAREIELLKGEALFQVAHNPDRPFTVKTGTATIRDVGTKFDVYKHADSATSVAVIEGVVQVTAPDATTAYPTRLAAGEEANIAGGMVVRQSKPDIGEAVAWRDRTLSFSGASLSEVANEFNRYNKIQIRIEGDAVRERRLSGVFSADHPQSVILFLAKDESLSVIPEGESWIVRAR
jgi:transmembrane sensor